MKTQFPLFLCLVAGIFMGVQYFIPAALPIYNRVNDYIQVVTAFSLVLGVVSLIHRHLGRMQPAARSTSGTGTGRSASRLLPAWAPCWWRVRSPRRTALPVALQLDPAAGSVNDVRAPGVLPRLGGVSRLSRAQRGRRRAPRARHRGHDRAARRRGRLKIPSYRGWILNGPNLVAKRAIILGVGLGMASTALKVVLGIERSYLGSGKE